MRNGFQVSMAQVGAAAKGRDADKLNALLNKVYMYMYMCTCCVLRVYMHTRVELYRHSHTRRERHSCRYADVCWRMLTYAA
jgi:hypothetical protein